MSWLLPKRAAAEAAQGAPEAKGRRKEAAKDPVDDLLLDVAKLSLNTAQRNRALEGLLCENWDVEHKGNVPQAMEAEGQRYAEAVEGKGADHPMGPPHIHKWRAMVQVFCKMDFKENKSLVASQEIIKEHVQELEKLR